MLLWCGWKVLLLLLLLLAVVLMAALVLLLLQYRLAEGLLHGELPAEGGLPAGSHSTNGLAGTSSAAVTPAAAKQPASSCSCWKEPAPGCTAAAAAAAGGCTERAAAGAGVGALSSPGECANQQTLRLQAWPSVHITVQNLVGCSHVSNTCSRRRGVEYGSRAGGGGRHVADVVLHA